jgi:hypothetical protein
MKESKTYSSEDFERYYGGKMTSVEMHELEERALVEPFLADALEGYQFTKSASKDMAELRSKILKNPKERIKVFSISRNNNWLRIAAVLVLITGASLIFYKINLNSNTKTVARSEIQKTNAADSVSLSAKIDSPANDNMAFQKEAPKALSEGNATSSQEKAKGDDKSVAINNHLDENKFKGKTEDSKVAEKSQNEKESSIEVALIQNDKAVEKKMMMSRNVETKAQKQNDTLGYMEANSKPLNNIISQSELEKTASSPAILSRNRNQSTAIKSLLVKANSTIEGQQLSSGNKLFDEYLKNNLQPVIINNTRQLGVVVLSFATDSTGKSQDIKIAYSTCNVCENRATELLKNGPLWEKNKTSEMVLIKFY